MPNRLAINKLINKKSVGKYQWHDHNAPPLEMLPEFCKHAADWLAKDKENIVAVHCKAGKVCYICYFPISFFLEIDNIFVGSYWCFDLLFVVVLEIFP